MTVMWIFQLNIVIDRLMIVLIDLSAAATVSAAAVTTTTIVHYLILGDVVITQVE